SERLAATLSRLATETQDVGWDVRMVVCQQTEGAAYVQFMVDDGGIYAEISSGRKFLPKQLRLSADALAALRDAGWGKPSRRGGNLEEILDKADPPACASLADKCVAGLRDVWRVPDPHSLVYRAFRSDTEADLDLSDLGLAREEA
ncbi:MAG: TY-Chap domain-containing protein, partial [Stackebrandtia sp.]